MQLIQRVDAPRLVVFPSSLSRKVGSGSIGGALFFGERGRHGRREGRIFPKKAFLAFPASFFADIPEAAERIVVGAELGLTWDRASSGRDSTHRRDGVGNHSRSYPRAWPTAAVDVGVIDRRKVGW